MLFGWKKAPAGCPNSKTQVVNTSPNSPDPNRTKFCQTIVMFISNLMEIVDFQEKSMNTAKKVEIVAKAELRYPTGRLGEDA